MEGCQASLLPTPRDMRSHTERHAAHADPWIVAHLRGTFKSLVIGNMSIHSRLQAFQQEEPMSIITRRSFVAKSVAAAGAASLASAVKTATPVLGLSAASRSGILGANERIRFAVIGTGGQGRHDLMTFFKHDNTGLECPLICDVDDAMLQATNEWLTKNDKPAAAGRAHRGHRRSPRRQMPAATNPPAGRGRSLRRALLPHLDHVPPRRGRDGPFVSGSMMLQMLAFIRPTRAVGGRWRGGRSRPRW